MGNEIDALIAKCEAASSVMALSDSIGPLGRIYTTAEAAQALGMGRRKLEALIAIYPHYTPNGNRKLFNDDDIRELWKVRRCRLSSPSVMEARVGTFVVPTTQEGRYSDLLKPKTARQPRRSSSKPRTGS